MRPDFGDLVGTDLGPDERARLEHVHDLLLAAGPPPGPIAAPLGPPLSCATVVFPPSGSTRVSRAASISTTSTDPSARATGPSGKRRPRVTSVSLGSMSALPAVVFLPATIGAA